MRNDLEIGHEHSHKLLSDTSVATIYKCECGDIITDEKSQTSMFPDRKNSSEPPVAPQNKLPRSYLRRIYGMARYIPLDDEELHQLVFLNTRSEHISHLSEGQARLILKVLKDLWEKKPDRISDKQISKIWKLGFKLKWYPRAVNKFCKRIVKHPHIFMLTISEGSMFIKALEGVIESEKKRAEKHD